MTFRRLLILLLPLVAVGCGYDSFRPYEPCESQPLVPNAPVSVVVGCVEQSGGRVPEGVVVEAQVVANDVAGNFYRTIVLQDASGAVELNVGLYDLHNSFPLGATVRVAMGGLECCTYNGVVQVGRTRYDYNPTQVEPLGLRKIVDELTEVVATGDDVVAESCDFDELNETLCGRLVSIEGVRYVGQEAEWGTVQYGSTANRLFLTLQGDSLVVATSRYADFAEEIIPSCEGRLQGILYCTKRSGKEIYTLKMRTAHDFMPL